ncbi:MAG: hypothetical protein IKA56_01775 [Clostridia bacterium]|nr:hypothetical protein [Clostridia bacterium]
MSYCVNCGVELDNGAESCPLCRTEVINPNITNNEEVTPSFPDRIYLPKTLNKRFGAFIASMVILLPNIVCTLVNILFYPDSNWCWIVNATSLLAWVIFVSPFFWKKTVSWALILIDSACVMGYSAVLCVLTGSMEAYFSCILPLIAVVSIIVGFFIEFKEHAKPGWPVLCIAAFTEILVSSLSVELIVRNYLNVEMLPAYSLIISACCAAVTGFFIAVATNKKLRMWLDRKFFVE